MKKINDIIKREYLSRVRKKSFLMMTFLGPLIMSVMMIGPIWFAQLDNQETHQIYVCDEGDILKDIPQHKNIKITKTTTSLAQATLIFNETEIQTLVYLDADSLEKSCIYTKSSNEIYTKYIQTLVEKNIYEHFINVRYVVPVHQQLATTNESQKQDTVKQLLSYGGVVLIYFFIFLYGIQVMKGVIEEKSNRIVEVMISIVKPVELMLGKIIGICLLGLTQFMIWLVLSGSVLFFLAQHFQIYRYSNTNLQETLDLGVNVDFAMDMNMLVTSLASVDLMLILTCFIFFFITGYLLYGALFAIVGAASDADTDTQQFIFPLTVPLFFSVSMTPNIIANPHGTLAKVLSYIPFSSPIVTMVRLPFADENPSFYYELIGIMICLILGFLLTTWVASRIYRVGILMYGQKIGYQELVKWFFYKE